MSNVFSNQQYLLNEQYKNASNLDARIQLHERFSTNKQNWHRWVFEHLQNTPKQRVLELGSGPGQLWRKNLDRIPHDRDITVSDFSPGMLTEARQHLQESEHPFTFQVIDAQFIPFADKTFDIVIANHMLYHVPDKAKAIREIRRILKSEGIFYASTIGQMHLREVDKLALQIIPDYTFGKEDSRNFTLENGASLLESAFAQVALHHFEDALVVTEAEPLIAYVLSGTIGRQTTERQIQTLRKLVEDKITHDGAFHITKATGLFEAYGQR